MLSSDHTRGKSQKPIGTSQLRPRGPDKYRCRKTSGTPGIAWFLYALRADGQNFSCSSVSRLFVEFGRDLSARMMDFASFEATCDGLRAMVRRGIAPLDGANVAGIRASASRSLFRARARRFRWRAATAAASRAGIARMTHFWRRAGRAPRRPHRAADRRSDVSPPPRRRSNESKSRVFDHRAATRAMSASSRAKQAQAFAELCGGAKFNRKNFKPVDAAVARSFAEGRGEDAKRDEDEGSRAARADSDDDDDESGSDSDESDSDAGRDARDVSTSWTPLADNEANAMRKRLKMRVQGADGACPAPLQGFEELHERYKCGRRLLERMREANFKEPTPIQRQAVPILCSGSELLAIAPTGSGKTLAFLLPIIMKLGTHEEGGARALLLAPTKELAGQSARILRILSRGVSGLKSCLLTKATAGNDFSKVDIVVATPMRLKILLQHDKIDLSKVLYLVLDEADKLFEMGFVEQIDAVVAACDNKDVTRALFSATLPEKVEELARSVMARPIRLTVGERNSASNTISQRMVFCGHEAGKLLALRQIIREGIKPPVIIFTQSKERAKHLAKELTGDGLHIGLIHAEMSDSKREEQVDRFRMGETWVLIATDLMARGMDFVGVSTVINFDFPGSPTSYIHRIGRSGRAGRPGAAITFFTEEDAQRGDLKPIANVMKNSGCEVPEWMLNHTGEKGLRRRKRKDGKEDNPRRAPLDMPMGADPKVYAPDKKKRKKTPRKKNDDEAMPPLPKKWKGKSKSKEKKEKEKK